MPNTVLQLLVAGGVMAVLDFVWLGTVAKTFYRSQIGKLLLDKPNMTAAVLFYVIYVVGVVLFVIAPAFEKASLSYALTRGALFGFVAYATYDLTNLATLRNWPASLAIIDIAWGTAVSAVCAGAGRLAWDRMAA